MLRKLIQFRSLRTSLQCNTTTNVVRSVSTIPSKEITSIVCGSLLSLNKASSATFCTSTETQPPPVPVASYEDVLDLPNRPEILLVDVREPNELAESGRIPTSINVPLGDVPVAFSDATSAATFLTKYGHAKPSEDEPLIFMCKIGRRSEMAANAVISLGFKNVKNYKGSWLDWAERNGLPQ